MKCKECIKYKRIVRCTVNTKEEHHSFNDFPAIESSDGDKYWFLNGKNHREDGPSIEWSNGAKFWYLNGKYHREDGPAVEYLDGTKYWFLNGKKHRELGPALEHASGNKGWYLNGVEVIQIPKQTLYIQKLIQIEDKMAIVINKINDNIWEALIGDKKELFVGVL